MWVKSKGFDRSSGGSIMVRKQKGARAYRLTGDQTKKLRRFTLALAITLIAATLYTMVSGYTQAAKHRQQLHETRIELNTLRSQYETETTQSEKDQKAKENKIKELNRKLEEVERQLLAKRQARAVFAEAQVPAYQPSGNKDTWLAASGIPESQWWAVDYIVSRESGWNPCAYNPGLSDCNANPSSACGLAQSLPCGKVPGHWTDPVANLKWQYQYVTERYGGYPQAVEFWKANHWY